MCFCFWGLWIQCIFKCLEGGWCLLLTTFAEGWFEAMFLNCSICGTVVTLFDLLRTLQASQASPLSWDKRIIPSKSRCLSVCTDIIEMFPATSENFLSCTLCRWSIPQVSGQNLLPGRSERPAKTPNWAGFAEIGNAFAIQRIQSNFCECCYLNLEETSLKNAWVTSSQGYLLWIELMFIDILKELFCMMRKKCLSLTTARICF